MTIPQLILRGSPRGWSQVLSIWQQWRVWQCFRQHPVRPKLNPFGNLAPRWLHACFPLTRSKEQWLFFLTYIGCYDQIVEQLASLFTAIFSINGKKLHSDKSRVAKKIASWTKNKLKASYNVPLMPDTGSAKLNFSLVFSWMNIFSNFK